MYLCNYLSNVSFRSPEITDLVRAMFVSILLPDRSPVPTIRSVLNVYSMKEALMLRSHNVIK